MTHDGLPDSLLVEKAKRGDWSAFEQLFWRYHEKIFTFALHLLQNREASEDVTQETFVKARESLHSLKSNDSFQPWLHQIARRLCIDILRKRSWEIPVSELVASGEPSAAAYEGENATAEFHADEEDDGQPDPEQIAIDNERKRMIQSAINQLSQPLREVVVLYYLEGLSVDEVAKVLGVPVGTVLSRLARAREALRVALARYLEDEGVKSK